MLDEAGLAGWEQEQDYDTFWTQEEIVPLTKTIQIDLFRPWIDQALAAVVSATEAA